MLKNRTKGIRQSLLACFVLCLLLTACEGSEIKQSPTPVTITFGCPGREENTYRQLANRFEADNPGIRVQLLNLDPEIEPGDMVKKADTLVMYVSPEVTHQNLVKDLSPFIEADGAFRPDDFYPNTLENVQWDGGIWGVPFAVHFSLVFYDKDAFDVAGVTYPEPGWTWDDFLTKAQALTEKAHEEVTRWGFVWRLRDPLPFVLGRAGPLVDTSVDPPVLMLDRPEVVEAVRWFADLALKYQVMPYLSPEQSGPVNSDAMRLVTGGQAAMWSEYSHRWGQQSIGRNLGIAPFPVDEPTSATTPIRLDSYVMSAGTAHPQESWRWLAFLSRQLIDDGTPARRSIAEQSGYWDNLEHGMADVYHFALEHGFTQVEAGGGLVGWGWGLHDALEAVLREEQDAREALATAQGSIRTEPGEIEASEPFLVSTPDSNTGNETSITFLATFLRTRTDERQQVYIALAEQFHERHPELSIAVKSPSFPRGSTRVTLQALAEQGDCLEFLDAFLIEDRNILLDLDPMIEGEAEVLLNDFQPPFLDAFRREGKLWGLPAEGFPLVMYYNKNLFDTAGLEYPPLDWNMNDFLNLTQALGKAGSNNQYAYMLSLGTAEPVFFVEQHGARLVDHTGSITLDTPAMAEAVRWYTNLIRLYGIPAVYDVRVDLLQKNRVAMWSDYPMSDYSKLLTLTEEEIGMTTMPQGTAKVHDFNLIGYGISAKSAHPKACWQWIKFLSEQMELIKGVPARQSIASSQTYRHQLDANLFDVYSTILSEGEWTFTSSKRLATERDRFISSQFHQAIEAILEDGVDLEQALSEAQYKAETYILCLETTSSYEDEKELIDTCISQVETSE
ncbi:MAG TPA: extracellular solute-binding protein [Chloroflexi bacterium]|nr:extracellular solute-binding protein [Chloroflexota bacterium]